MVRLVFSFEIRKYSYELIMIPFEIKLHTISHLKALGSQGRRILMHNRNTIFEHQEMKIEVLPR